MQPHSSELGQKMTSEGAGDDKPEVRGDGLSTHNRITIHKTEVSMMRYGRKQSCDGNSSQRHPAPRALLGRFIWGMLATEQLIELHCFHGRALEPQRLYICSYRSGDTDMTQNPSCLLQTISSPCSQTLFRSLPPKNK